MKFDEIAKVLGISTERVRRIYERALLKLSRPHNKEKWERILETIAEIEIEKAKSDSNTLDFKEV